MGMEETMWTQGWKWFSMWMCLDWCREGWEAVYLVPNSGYSWKWRFRKVWDLKQGPSKWQIWTHSTHWKVQYMIAPWFSITPQNKILSKIRAAVFNTILTEDINAQGVITKNWTENIGWTLWTPCLKATNNTWSKKNHYTEILVIKMYFKKICI